MITSAQSTSLTTLFVIEIDIHFVRDKVAIGEVKVLFVPSSLQFADVFTKGIPTSLFNKFRTSLTVHREGDRIWNITR